MLAEIYILKLEAAVRAVKEAANTASTSRFVPVTYRLPRRPNPAFHTGTPRIQNNSGLPHRITIRRNVIVFYRSLQDCALRSG
jgi:hypothetical protein